MSTWIRQFHRWISVAFTLAVVINFAVLGFSGQEPAMWVYLMPLLPLALLLLTGLYLFVLPYVDTWRSGTPDHAKE